MTKDSCELFYVENGFIFSKMNNNVTVSRVRVLHCGSRKNGKRK